MTTTQPHPERRRRDLVGRLARATWPAKQAFDDLTQDLPCRILGHKWVEVPATHMSARARDAHRMRFKCSRCYLTGGFSN